MDIIGLYKKMVLSLLPSNLEKQLKTDKGTLGDGIKNVVLAALAVDLLFLIAMVVQVVLFSSMADMAGDYGTVAAFGGGFGIMTVVMLIVIPIIMVVVTLISTALSFVLCRILGGKGTFENQYYQFSIVGSGLAIVGGIFNIIPLIGGLVLVLLDIYYLYPVYLVYKGVHKLSSLMAALAVFIPIILAVILFVLFMGYFMASLTSVAPVPVY